MIKDNNFYTTLSHSAQETERLGAELANEIYNNPDIPKFVALYGDLGVGKTAFVRGFVGAVAPDAVVKSPTFALVNEYRSGRIRVYHFDMYRVESWDDLYSSGFFDFYESGGILSVEWAENIENALPENTIRVTIQRGESDNQRIITIDGGEII